MAFFSKLKDRLFKSSAKLEKGLDAIVEEGAEAAVSQPDVSPEPAPVESPVETPVETPAEPPVEAPVAPPVEVPAEAPKETPTEAPSEVPTAPAQGDKVQPAPVRTEPVAKPMPKPSLTPVPTPKPEPVETPKAGLLGRLIGRGKAEEPRRVLDDDMLEQLEELLISSDMGVDTALRVSANMAEGRFGKRLSTDEIKALLAAELARILEPVARPMPIYPKRPQVVLVVGVNGSGKTTTIGKLASQFRFATNGR